MPRLTKNEYLARCRYLRNLWSGDQRAFALLAPDDQANLYE